MPWVIQALDLEGDGRRGWLRSLKRREISARLAEYRCTALARLDALEGAVSSPDTVAALKRRHTDRRSYFVAACQDLGAQGQTVGDLRPPCRCSLSRPSAPPLPTSMPGAKSATMPGGGSSVSWTWRISASGHGA